MKRRLYRQITAKMKQTADGSINLLVVFPPATFANAPYWTPGTDFEICMPNRTWYRDNRDGTVDILVSYVTPKVGIAACGGGDWTEPELWMVRVPAGHDRLTTVLWDKPHRITHFLAADEDEQEGIISPSEVVSRAAHHSHPIEEVLEYWDNFSVEHGFVPRRLKAFAGLEDRFGLVIHWPRQWSSDLGVYSISELTYTVTKITREFGGEIHLFDN